MTSHSMLKEQAHLLFAATSESACASASESVQELSFSELLIAQLR